MKSCHLSIQTFKEEANNQSKEVLNHSACISITDVCQANLDLNPNWKYQFKSKFYDIDNKKHPQAFNDGLALEVIDFMKKVYADPEVDELIIHCHAGISRSRAFHCFFQYYIVEDPSVLNNPPAYIGNALVYNSLVKMFLS